MDTRWIFLILGIVGCSSVAEPGERPHLVTSARIDQPFDLKVGERAFIDDADSYLRFVEVKEDSRCPSNELILCVWEGDAAVVVEIEPVGGSVVEWTLHTTLDPKELELGELVLRLEELAPYPATTEPIPAEKYVATFVVVGR